jgi:hypothetical protein
MGVFLYSPLYLLNAKHELLLLLLSKQGRVRAHAFQTARQCQHQPFAKCMPPNACVQQNTTQCITTTASSMLMNRSPRRSAEQAAQHWLPQPTTAHCKAADMQLALKESRIISKEEVAEHNSMETGVWVTHKVQQHSETYCTRRNVASGTHLPGTRK